MNSSFLLRNWSWFIAALFLIVFILTYIQWRRRLARSEQITWDTDSLPPSLQALIDLEREALSPTVWWRGYIQSMLLSVVYGFIAFLQIHTDNSAVMLFFAALTIMFSLHGELEARTQKRLRLILEVLREQSIKSVSELKSTVT